MIVDNAIFFAAVEQQISEGKRVKIVLRGQSMLPTLREGDEVVLAPLDSAPAVGDIVLFRHGGHYLLHRYVEGRGETMVMQGDHCYGRECCERKDVVAKLVAVTRIGGVEEEAWAALTQRALRVGRWRHTLLKWGGSAGRRKLRPWYFAVLTLLMWAPLNGLGLRLNNYILGLRLDHLLHASVFLPCAWFLVDLMPRRWQAWGGAVLVGLLMEGVQYLLPYRGFDVNDLVANIIGVTLGWMVGRLVVGNNRHA